MTIKKKKLQFQDQLSLASRIGIYCSIIFVVISMGIPMLNVLAVSFSERAKSESPGLILFPAPFTLEGYDFIWNHANLWRPFLTTLYISVAGTLVHVFLSGLAGYVLIHKELPLRNLMTTFVMLTMTVPGELTLISLYEINRQLGLINTYTALIINGAVGGFSVLLMRNYFSGLPPSLAEASRIDGASDFMIFLRVYVPLSVPGIMTISTLQFIGRWNSIATVISLISDMNKYTLPVVLRLILFENSAASGTSYIFANAKMAAVALTALPLIGLYFFTQRFFTSGVLLGATKE
ncbi:MAG: carbohydrate ABC transporter permease [Treponema sp.]|nr:carbohydrate ABC transporter permease [Treponema sp.]